MGTLRFNFRHGDDSLDPYADEEDNLAGLLQISCEDLGAAVALVSRRAPTARRVLIGYSWGAYVSLMFARNCTSDPAHPSSEQPHAIALVAPPLAKMPLRVQLGRGDFARWPMFLMCGDADEYCPAQALRDAAGDSATAMVLLKSTRHFLHGRTAQKAATHVREWADGLGWADPLR